MSDRTVLKIKMALLSDAIFSSGNSIPGGEDISVYTDSEGYPYYKATSLKGVLRESTDNLLRWKGKNQSELAELFGEEGFEGTSGSRRINFTDFVLENKPADSDLCYSYRAFTKVEYGVASDGSLRMAKCINSGLLFKGEIECDPEDEEIIVDALKAVKWIGASRNRGFGRVKFEVTEKKVNKKCSYVLKDNTSCIRYTITTEQPLIITKLSTSSGTGYETRNYIPGSAIRGMVVNKLSESEEFENFKKDLLTDKVRFLNAFPNMGSRSVIPSIMGYYATKAEPNKLTCVLEHDIEAGMKRAKIGMFCSLEDGKLVYSSTQTDGYTRINKNDKSGMFQTRHISAGQSFTGYIIIDEPYLVGKITSAFDDVIWIGADRYEGFGKCKLERFESVDRPSYYSEYETKSPVSTLYMLALSPFTMLDADGEPCGINQEELAAALGVEKIDKIRCSTSVSEYGAFNRTWGAREPAVRMYDSGSIFKLECSEAPDKNAIWNIEKKGIGIRRAEGYGQVLFLDNHLFEKIKISERYVQLSQNDNAKAISDARKNRIRIISDTAVKINQSGLSNSQLGEVEGAVSGGRDYFDDLIDKKNDLNKERYKKIKEIVDKQFDDARYTEEESCDILVRAIRHSRKKSKKK